MGDDPGGIARLHAVLRDHRWTLEADLLRFFQVDLLDLHRGLLSWRRLTVLYRALPRESMTRIAEHGIEQFGATELLLDEIRRDQWVIATSGAYRPEPMPGSPLALTPAQRAEKAAERRREHEAAEAREAKRQAWIRAQQAQTPEED